MPGYPHPADGEHGHGDAPHDPDAEAALLGCMLTSARAIADADAAGVTPQWFYRPRHELIFHAIRDLHAAGTPADPTLVVAHLMDRREIDRAGGAPYIHALVSRPLTAANADYYAAIVRGHWLKRGADTLALSMRRMVRETEPDDIPAALARMRAQLEALEQDAAGLGRERRAALLTPVSQIGIRPVRWLWDTTPPGAAPTSQGRIPLNSLCIAAGGPGLGKSQFAAWLAARVTTGTLPGELHGTRRAVIYAASEDSWAQTIAPRMVAAGADLGMVLRIDVRDDEDPHARLTLPVDVRLLGAAAEHYSAGLVVADPLLSLIDERIDDYRQKEVRKALEPLARAADEYRFTLLGIAHFTKSGTPDPLGRISGSGAFGQVVRSALAFARQEGDDGAEFVMSQVKNNLGRLDVPSFAYTIQPVTVDTQEGPSYVSRFVLGAETALSVAQAMRDEANPGAREAAGEVAVWLRGYLEDLGGGEQRREVLKAARKEGYAETAVERARRALGLVTRTSGFGKARVSVWHLPQ